MKWTSSKIQVRRLFNYLKFHRWYLVFPVLTVIIYGVVDPYKHVFFESFINEGLLSVSGLIKVFSQFFLVSLINITLDFLTSIQVGYITSKFAQEIRRDFYRHLNKLSFDYFVRNEKGQVISKFTNDVERCKDVIDNSFYMLSHVITIGMTFFLVAIRHFKFAIISFIIIPILIFTLKSFSKRLIHSGRKIQEQIARFVMIMQDFLSGIRIVKALGTEKYELRKFDTENDNNFRAVFNNVKMKSIFDFSQGIIVTLAIIGILAYGGYEVIGGRLEVGTFIYFIVALSQVQDSADGLFEHLAEAQTALYASERIFNLLDTKPTVLETTHPVKMTNIKGYITFDSVSLKYPERKRFVLTGVNVNVDAGEFVAIVGKSGSGKSSLVNLLLRLYDPTLGIVKLDGIDIKKMSMTDLRKHVSIVPQDTFLFHDTIYDNIIHGLEGAKREDVIEAAEQAYVLEFTEKLPNGLDTVVEEGGLNLSGGQRQRIAIARAILRKPRILILDEATTGLDVESEKYIVESLEKLMTSCTTFMVTHDLEPAEKADKIILMADGEVKEVGTHKALLDSKGFYYNMYSRISNGDLIEEV